MTIQKYYLFFIMCLFLFPALNAISTESQNRPVEELIAVNPVIKIGEPLIIELKYTFPFPRRENNSNKIQQTVSLGDAHGSVYIKDGNDENIGFEIAHPSPLICRDNKGLIYSNYFIIFSNRDTKKLMFNKPGTYIIEFDNQEQLDNAMNKPTTVEVKSASEQEKKALSLLTGKDDLMILVRDNYRGIETKYPGVIDRYKKVVEQCPDTMISKLAATCIGMVLYNDYEEQRIFLNINEQYKLKTIAKEAMEYLEKGLELPDEFPIREDILYMLTESEIEVGEKKYSKAIAYLEELSEKYPYGRWGKSALSGIEEIKTMMANDPNWANRVQAKENEKEQSPKKPLGVALPITGAAVAVIAIASLVFFSRKKNLNKTE